MNEHRTIEDDNVEEIDLLSLFNILWSKKIIIASCCLVFSFVGLLFAFSKQANYEADLLIQIEKEKPSLPGIVDFSEMLASAPESNAELEIIKSRTVIGQAVEELNLQTHIVKKNPYFW